VTKYEAVWTLINEALSGRCSKTALQRIRRACKTIGFSDAETMHAEERFGYRGHGGAVYSVFESKKP
jgi:hypothetical protein